MIGLELAHRTGLVEWFLAQSGSISGYQRAVFSGFTTSELARIIEMVLVDHPRRFGLYHVSSEPVDKHTLLSGLRERLDRDIEIIRSGEFICDRSLDSTRFRQEFDYNPPSWDDMLNELSEQIKARSA